ncbi:MAG: YggT family protein [Paracoccaceae bacterium]
MIPLITAILLFLKVVFYVILAQVIMSWLISFQVLNLRQPFVAQVWDLLNRALAPIYAPIRRIMPATPGIDFTPMVVIIGMILLQKLLISFAGYGAPAF